MIEGRNLKVALDISTLLNQGQDIGAGRYILNLINGLLSLETKNRYILFGTYSDGAYLPLVYDLKKKYDNADISFRFLKAGPLALRAYEHLRFPPVEFLGLKADVLHAMDYAIIPTLNRNIVLTIHDLAFIRFPQLNFEWFIKKYSSMVRKNANAARKILASSQSTADDIHNFFNIDRKKIEAVHLAAGPEFRRLAPNEIDCTLPDCMGIKKPFLLSVGTIEPRKDFVTLIRAYSLARDKDPGLGYQLAIAGRTGWKSEATFEARERSLYKDDIIFTGRLTDRELIQLYNQAGLFLYTSLFEGFGLPPLEAMSCGLPVICSDCPSIREVVADAGILVEPGDADGFAEKIIETANNKESLKALSNKAVERSKVFSWKKTAEKTLLAYSEVASAG